MRAAVYARFSTDRQNESSISDQVRVCSEYAERQGWNVVQLFEDQGISGAAMGNRPGVLKASGSSLRAPLRRGAGDGSLAPLSLAGRSFQDDR